MEGLVLGGEGIPSVYKLARQIKRDDVALFHCLRSIAADAAFVDDITRLYPSLPVFANLRCGLWYAPKADDTCYFKHVAMKAAAAGGCVIVDATRSSTKRFPDSFSKTIPMWCAVLNRAVERHRRRRLASSSQDELVEKCAPHCGSPREGDCEFSTSTSGCDLANAGWDTSIRLPLWVGESERVEIESRLDSWVDNLEAIGADIGILERVLTKPLRPMWISQHTRIWTNRVKSGDDLPFCPVVLLSASAPLQSDGPQRGQGHLTGYGWTYVPGAGDDEESWGCGLTAQMFWAPHYHDTLLAAGPAECQYLVRQTVERERTQLQVTVLSPESAPILRSARLTSHELAGASDRACTDAHHPAPKGCEAAWAAGEVFEDGSLRCIGATGIVIGRITAAIDLNLVWEKVDAVIHCGLQCLTVPAQCSAHYLHTPVVGVKSNKHALEEMLPKILAFASYQLSQGKRLLVCCESGLETSVCIVVAILVCHFDSHVNHFHATSTSPADVSKDDIRQRLRVVSSHHPQARPSRGMLKQVFNYCRSVQEV